LPEDEILTVNMVAYFFMDGVNFESFGSAIMVKYKTLKPDIAELKRKNL